VRLENHTVSDTAYLLLSVYISGGPEIQAILPPNAKCGFLFWCGSWAWSCQALHCTCPPDNLTTLPVPEGCYQWSDQCHQKEAWRGGKFIWQGGQINSSPVHWSTAKATTSFPTVWHDSTKCLEATERASWKLCYHSSCLALWAFPSPVSCFSFGVLSNIHFVLFSFLFLICHDNVLQVS